RFVAGGPEQVRATLEQMLEESGADESIVQDMIADPADRRHSHKLLAGAFGSTPRQTWRRARWAPEQSNRPVGSRFSAWKRSSVRLRAQYPEMEIASRGTSRALRTLRIALIDSRSPWAKTCNRSLGVGHVALSTERARKPASDGSGLTSQFR